MKKLFLQFTALILITVSLSSCATLFGGKVSSYQKTKPAAGQPARELRVGAFLADLFIFWPALAVDFSNGAIYKPKK